jgi:hypothetical protein
LFSDDKNHIPMIFFGILKDITWPISINQIEPCGVEFFDSETRILLRKKFFSTPTPIPKKMKYPPRTPTPKKKSFWLRFRLRRSQSRVSESSAGLYIYNQITRCYSPVLILFLSLIPFILSPLFLNVFYMNQIKKSFFYCLSTLFELFRLLTLWYILFIKSKDEDTLCSHKQNAQKHFILDFY